MTKSILSAVVFFLSLNVFASSTHFQGFVEIEKGRSLFVDWLKPQGNKPNIVLLNGLTYNTTSWDLFATELAHLGYGVFRYDPIGMGHTLLKYAPIKEVISIENQAKDLDLLTRKVGLTGKLQLLGLSYGGGLANAFTAKYASRIQNAILIAPYTEPLSGQDSMIKAKVSWVRMTQPWNQASNDELYSYFLRENVYYVYPLTEPSVLENPYKPEAVFQMTQGIRKVDILGHSQKYPKKSVHLILAGNDQYIPRNVLLAFWDQLPQLSKASQVTILHSEHKVPEAWPFYLAGLVNQIVEGKPEFFKGDVYFADPILNTFLKQ